MGVIAAVCSVVVAGGIYAAVLVYIHSRKKRQGNIRTDIQMAALQMTRTATHGDGYADEGAGGGEGARPPYLQIAVAGVPTAASAERVVPVGIQTDIQLTRTATNGDGDADEGAGGGPEGDWARPPYLQIAVAVAGVPAAAPSADEGAGGLAPSRRRRNDEVPVGLPVAACADGSWAPASGGGADATDLESGEVTDSFQQRYQSHQHREGFVVATGFVPNV